MLDALETPATQFAWITNLWLLFCIALLDDQFKGSVKMDAMLHEYTLFFWQQLFNTLKFVPQLLSLKIKKGLLLINLSNRALESI